MPPSTASKASPSTRRNELRKVVVDPQKAPNQEPATDPQQRSSGNGLFRRSRRGKDVVRSPKTRRISKKRTKPETLATVDDDVVPTADYDPVMALFEARSTQRVRFSLEGLDGNKKTAQESKPPEAPPDAKDDSQSSPTFNIKAFMRRTLFRGGREGKSENEDGETNECEDLPLLWENNDLDVTPEVFRASHSQKKGPLKLSFAEEPGIRAKVVKLLNKARRAQFAHCRYEYAVKCNVKAHDLLTQAKYPEDHPLFVKTLRSLGNAHHALSSFNNSANIVKMGIRCEENGDLIRALKMYTIAYRIRRDQLSRNHPSLVVILNILGSIQIKRGELKEAMQIYQLSLKDSPMLFSTDEDASVLPTPTNLLARAVTYREMGTIYEKWGDEQKALQLYHRSLECVCEWRESCGKYLGEDGSEEETNGSDGGPLCSLDNLQLTRSFPSEKKRQKDGECGEMEVFINFSHQKLGISGDASTTEFYNSFFPEATDDKSNKKAKLPASQDVYADVDVALTLHQIAQMHRRQGEYGRALDAYHASIRGMKHALGYYHPNVAAILGNIGNLQKEVGDLDAAFDTYQEVLRMESYRLGVSHPEVAISLHNVATIEAARGNYENALRIYDKVLVLQKMLFGADHPSVAVTSTCMGDVHERLGNLKSAIERYEEALSVKMIVTGRHHLEVGRMLHKLGKMLFVHEEYNLADSYLSRAVLIYRLNRLPEDDPWLIDADRDSADIDAAIAFGKGKYFEC